MDIAWGKATALAIAFGIGFVGHAQFYEWARPSCRIDDNWKDSYPHRYVLPVRDSQIDIRGNFDGHVEMLSIIAPKNSRVMFSKVIHWQTLSHENAEAYRPSGGTDVIALIQMDSRIYGTCVYDVWDTQK
jgi:hypothetical protein